MVTDTQILDFIRQTMPTVKTKDYPNGRAYVISLDVGHNGSFVGGEFRDFRQGIEACIKQLKEMGFGE